MQVTGFVASLIGAFTSAGILEILELVPWRPLLGLAAQRCVETSLDSSHCLTPQDLQAAFVEHDERSSQERITVSCAPCPALSELDSSQWRSPKSRAEPQDLLGGSSEQPLSAPAAVALSLALVFTWVVCFAAGRWSTRRGRGSAHPAMGLGRPPTRARAITLPEGGAVPDLARRIRAR